MQLTKEDFAYTHCYCEENSWLLMKQLAELGDEEGQLFAVFISNKSLCVGGVSSFDHKHPCDS